MLYLYGFEDGTIKQCKQEPTEADLLAVKDGTLYVYRITTVAGILVEELNPDDSWTEVEEAEIEQTHGESWHA